MKKLVRLNKMLLTAMLCVCTMFGTSIVVHAQSTDEMPNEEKIDAREILSGTSTQTIKYGANAVTVTIRYTWRYESSNYSGKYITGILGGSIRKAYGWTAISNTHIFVNSVSYLQNQQIALIPFSYCGSVGQGYEITVNDNYYLTLL